VEVSGAERTTFYPVVQATARDFHLAIRPDPAGSRHYYRSDHFSLARVGVPSFSINEGIKFAGHPAEWERSRRKISLSTVITSRATRTVRHGFLQAMRVIARLALRSDEGDMAADARRLGSRRRIRARTKAESSISWNPEFLTPHLLFRDEGSGPIQLWPISFQTTQTLAE